MSVRIPFDSLAVIGMGDAWSEGFAEEIARMLAPSRDLRVVPPQRVRAYAPRETPAEEIGRDVHARCVAVCRVAATEAAVDLDIEVIDVLAERVAAEESFLTMIGEILALQERAARWLANVVCGSERQLARPPVMSAGSYVAVLRARGSDPREAIALLRAHDDGSVLVARELARAVAHAREVEDADVAAARKAIERALRLDPRDAGTHVLAAVIRGRFDHDLLAAATHYARAVALDPASPEARAGYGLLLASRGDGDAAERELRAACDLAAPLDRARLARGYGLAFAGRILEAKAHFASMPELRPEPERDDWTYAAVHGRAAYAEAVAGIGP